MKMTLSAWRKAYTNQQSHAKRRKIEFKLSFYEWLDIWAMSEKLPNRGRGGKYYCMARFGDKGPYAVDNVEIITFHQNCVDGALGRRHSAQTKWKMGCGNRGKPSPLKGRVRPPGVRAKISASNKGKHTRKKSEAEKLHLSRVLKGRQSKRKGRIFSNVHRLTKQDVALIKELKAQGTQWDALKKRFGVSRYTIWRALSDPNYGRV